MEVFLFGGETGEGKREIDHVQSLIWTERYTDLGEFQLKLPLKSEALELIQKGDFLRISPSNVTMIVESFDLFEGVMEISGRELASILDRRIILQTVPSKPPKLMTWLHRLVDNNISHFATAPERAIPYLNVSYNEPVGFVNPSSYEAVGYGDNLLASLIKICKDFDLGFELELVEPYMLFNLTYRRNLTEVSELPVFFDLSSEIASQVRKLEGRQSWKNVAYVNLPPKSGEGIGKTRKVVRGVDWYQNLERRELWVSASNIRQDPNYSGRNENNMMDMLGRMELAEHQEVLGYDFELNNLGAYQYGRDYTIGDIVGVLGAGDRGYLPYQVKEYIFSYAKGVTKNYPTLELWNEELFDLS